MLHPMGPLPSVVYWRRRLLVLAPVLLVGLTAYVACSGGPGKPTAHQAVLPARSSSSPAGRTPAAASNPVKPARSGTTQTPTACARSALKISAATGAASYPVGAKPVLYLQVTNAGTVPCVEDLSDPQIVLMVYNGASRVWGSHDCAVMPGSRPQLLPVHRAVRRSITWTGLSSQPHCVGTRQRVGPGRYTLHAELAGIAGTTAQFTIGERQG